MKKSILTALIICITICLSSIQSYAQYYFEYTIEGKEYKFKNEGVDFSSSVVPENTTIGERNSKQLAIYLMSDSGVLYSLRVMIQIDIDKEFIEGKYDVNKDVVSHTVLPVGYFLVTKNPGTNDSHFFKTKDKTGSIVINKITNEYVEGIFEGEVMLDEIVLDSKTKTSIQITNGKFRFPAENLTFYH